MPTQDEVRAVALAQPETDEHLHFDRPSFRVRGKIFATLPPGGDCVVLKLPPEIQETLADAELRGIEQPKHWSRYGWTQIPLARMSGAKMADLVRLAWRQVAPKRLAAKDRG